MIATSPASTATNPDARPRILAVAVFLVTLASFERHEVIRLVPFAVFPLCLLHGSGAAIGSILRRSLLALPFVLCVALPSPWLDSTPVMTPLGPLSRGWFTCASLLLRGYLAVLGALALAATTGFPELCRGLERLGCPRALATQLLLLYRYLGLLGDEVTRVARARRLRAPEQALPGPALAASMLGSLLLRSVARAERVHGAMLLRGFDGVMPAREESGEVSAADVGRLFAWLLFFATVRLAPVGLLLGARP